MPVRVKDFVIQELSSDGIHFANELYAGLLAEFSAQVEHGATYDAIFHSATGACCKINGYYVSYLPT